MSASQSMSQNAMEHALYRDIAAQLEDRTMIEVKAECKLRYGVVLLKGSDPEWAEWYDRAIKPMKYEDKLLLMQEYPITSLFNVEQGSQYITDIIRDYARQGVYLDHPSRHDPSQGNRTPSQGN